MTTRLVYVIGPSGAGKDSVLHGLCKRWSLGLPVHWARRTITRHPQAGGEPNESVTPVEFEQLLHIGALAMHWEGNGLRYGIRCSEMALLERGHCVLINGSRPHFAVLKRELPGCTLVHITAPAEVLLQRLAARGRENAKAVAERMAREVEQDWPKDTIRIVNDGPLASAVERLHSALAARLTPTTASA